MFEREEKILVRGCVERGDSGCIFEDGVQGVEGRRVERS